MNKNGIIYKAVSPSGKVYIGQTIKTLDIRKKHHTAKAFCKKSKQYNSKFSFAIRKYNERLYWKILYINIPIGNLDHMEIKTIKKYNSFNKGYNGNLGGVGNKGYVMSDETKKKLSKINSGKNHPMYGKSISEETKRKISKSKLGSKNPMYGKHLSEEHKKKLSIASSGKNNPMYGKFGKNHPAYGKKRTIEGKIKISKANSGENNGKAKLSWEKVNKIRSEYKKNPCKYKILAKKYDISNTLICQIINNKIWKYSANKTH